MIGALVGAAGIAVVGLVAGFLGTLMWGVGGVVLGLMLLAVAATVLVFGIRRTSVSTPPNDLLVLPVAPDVPQRAQGLVRRLHLICQERGESADEGLEIGLSAFRLLARLSDPEDFSARIAGGAQGQLGDLAGSSAREVVDLLEAGRGAVSSQESARLHRLKNIIEDTGSRLDTIEIDEPAESDSIAALEAQLASVGS